MAPTIAKLTVRKNRDYFIRLIVVDEQTKQPKDLTGMLQATWGFGRSRNIANALFSTSGVIEGQPTAGKLIFTINQADLNDIKADPNYYHEAVVTDAAGKTQSPVEGQLELLETLFDD
jgi:hypothetical protein